MASADLAFSAMLATFPLPLSGSEMSEIRAQVKIRTFLEFRIMLARPPVPLSGSGMIT